jgi:hypothetical protein
VRKRYLDHDQEYERNIHKELGGYFMERADPSGDKSFESQDARALGEISHHFFKSRQWKILWEILCNLDFVESRCKLGNTLDLVCDYLEASTGNWKVNYSIILGMFSYFVGLRSIEEGSGRFQTIRDFQFAHIIEIPPSCSPIGGQYAR